MTIFQMKIRCSACGGEQFIQPDKADLDDADLVRCAACGHEITVADARQQGFDAGLQLVADAVRRAIEGDQ